MAQLVSWILETSPWCLSDRKPGGKVCLDLLYGDIGSFSIGKTRVDMALSSTFRNAVSVAEDEGALQQLVLHWPEQYTYTT